MKKVVLFILLFSLLFVSCSSVNTKNNTSLLRYMGKDGSIIITGKAGFFDVNYADKIQRINVLYSEENISGCIEGSFSKLEGYVATKYVDFGSLQFDYFQPRRGLMYFSTGSAKDFGKGIGSDVPYIDDLDYSRIEGADFAIYSVKPLSGYKNIEKIMILITDGICTAEIKVCGPDEARGLFTSLKASYVSYLNKNKISVDYRKLSSNFQLIDDCIYINNLEYDGFFNSFVEEFLRYGE